MRAKDWSTIPHLYFADCRYSFRFINFDRLRELIAPKEQDGTEKNRGKKRITATRRDGIRNLIIDIGEEE